jgi:hypothetical protein
MKKFATDIAGSAGQDEDGRPEVYITPERSLLA